MPITVDREEESVSWNISEFALPSNLNLLYGQTLIYVLQSFGNSGKLRFSYYKNISGVFMILIPTSIKYITIRKYIGGENYANNVEHSQFYLWSRREQFSVFFGALAWWRQERVLSSWYISWIAVPCWQKGLTGYLRPQIHHPKYQIHVYKYRILHLNYRINFYKYHLVYNIHHRVDSVPSWQKRHTGNFRPSAFYFKSSTTRFCFQLLYLTLDLQCHIPSHIHL